MALAPTRMIMTLTAHAMLAAKLSETLLMKATGALRMTNADLVEKSQMPKKTLRKESTIKSTRPLPKF